jgi:hypothetical protein
MPKKSSKKGVGRPAKVTPVKVAEDVEEEDDEVKSDAETDDAPPAKKMAIRKNKPGPASSKIQGNKKPKEKEYEVRKKIVLEQTYNMFFIG